MESENLDFSNIIGRKVHCKMDRPLGSHHPRHPEMRYPINYGYIEGIMAADGAWQDIYLMGIDVPVEEFDGVVIGVYHRLNDVEDKWIVAPVNTSFTKEQILDKIHFQEQYFIGELYM